MGPKAIHPLITSYHLFFLLSCFAQFSGELEMNPFGLHSRVLTTGL